MNILLAKTITPHLEKQLINIWEKAVRVTHQFLSDLEVAKIKELLPQALREPDYLILVEKEENVIAFMGIKQKKLEMLFITPEEQGKGLGKSLIQFGIKNYSINEVTVNEQNFIAKAFYERMGFKVFKRTDLDEQGNPYPLLYMKLV